MEHNKASLLEIFVYGERWEFRVSTCNEFGCGPCNTPVVPFLVGSPLMLEEDKGYSKRDGLRD
jgi:hypothetical protein